MVSKQRVYCVVKVTAVSTDASADSQFYYKNIHFYHAL